MVYFRYDVFDILKALFKYKSATQEFKKILWFLTISTLVSGVIRGALWIFLVKSVGLLSGQLITVGIEMLLLITAIVQFKAKNYGNKEIKDLNVREWGILLGTLQGLSVLPVISRSGMTISGLLLQGFNKTASLRLSFLMSLPVVFGANIVLNCNDALFNLESIVSLTFAFIFGLLIIHGLIKLSHKINFSWFVLIFGILAILAGAFI